MGMVIVPKYWLWLFLLGFGVVIILLFPFLKKVFWDRERDTGIRDSQEYNGVRLDSGNGSVGPARMDVVPVNFVEKVHSNSASDVLIKISDMPRKVNWRGDTTGG